MPRMYFNWKLAIVLLIGLVILGATAFGLRQWQRSRRAESGLEAGNKAYEEQNWEEAAEQLGRYLAVERDDVEILLKYADAQLNIRPLARNRIEQAVAAYRAVLRIEGSNSKAATRLTSIYLQMGMPGEAELIAKRQLEASPDPELRRILAVAVGRQRRFEEAASELKSIVAEHPEEVQSYETLGQLAEQRPEDFSDPPEYWFNKAVENNPSSALAYVIRAGFYLRNKDQAKALADLEQAEKQDLSDPVVRLRLATEFINAQALDKAEQQLAAVHKADPANQILWQTWARSALASQSREKMLQVADTGLKELSSQPWDFMPTAAELYIQCGGLDRAAECLSELQAKDIAPSVVAFLRGLLASKKGQPLEAVKYWRQATELGNASPRVRLALASALSLLGNTQSALQQVRNLVSESPDLFEGRLALAKLLGQTGKWGETEEHARAARQLSPDNLEAALVHLRARIQLLAARTTGDNTQQWQEIDKELVQLQDSTDSAPVEIGLLRFRVAIQQGDFAGAQALVTELKQAYPSQPKAALTEVELLSAQEKTDEAISLLNNIIKDFPDATEPVVLLAVLLASQDKRQECEKGIEDALTRIKEPAAQQRLCFTLADLYGQWGQEDKAYNVLASLGSKLPDDIPVKRRLLRCRQIAEDPEKAQQLVDHVKSLEGEDGWQWRYEQAKLWYNTGDFTSQYAQIISLLQENLLANPDDQTSRILLAATYERGGELQLAISTYREALNRSPDDLRVIVPAVAALYRAREYDEVERVLNRASREKLYHPELQRLQLASHLRRGELSPASDILQELLRSDPNNPSVCLSLALLEMRQNRFDEADQLLTKLRVQEPNSLPVVSAQIQLKIHQKKPQEALELCNEWVNEFDAASAYLLRARTYATVGQIDKAIADYEHAAAAEPNNIGVWAAKSDFYGSIGRLEKATADIEQALSLAPENAQIQRRAVSLLLASRNPDKIRQGRTILEEALKSNPGDSGLRLFEARSLLAEGTAPAIEKALQLLQKLTEDNPRVADAWVLLGELALRQAQPGRAIDIALRGLVHNDNDEALLTLKARAEAMRSPSLAIPTLRVLREQDPNDVDTAVLLANTYMAAGEPEKAVTLLRNQLSVCDDSTRRQCNLALAVALHRSGNKAESQGILDSLCQSEPNDPRPLFAQAQLLRDDKNWSRLSQMVSNWCENHPTDSRTPVTIAADLMTNEDSQAKKASEEILQTVLQKNPDSTGAMRVLAMLMQTTGRSVESAQLYLRILELEPDNVIAMNNLAWILCEEQGKYQQALELTQKGLKLAPQYIDLIDTRGVVYYRLGELDKAVQDFTRCIGLYQETAPSCTATHFHLGRALERLGQKARAVENLKKAIELNGENGGLSTVEVDETQRLIEKLSEGA